MKQRILHIIIGLMVVLTTAAQTQFRTSELRRLASVLAIDASQLPEGYSQLTANGNLLTIHSDKQTVDHIGLQLFSPEMRKASSSRIFDFLERYFLQLKYPPKVKSTANMLRDDQFRFLQGNLSVVDNLSTSDDFTFSNDNLRYIATWTRQGRVLLSVSFPVEYELISGENKIEAEENLLSDIQKTQVKSQKEDLQRNDNYINECFSNRLYLQNGRLISSSHHPAETLANLMLSTQARGQYDIKVTQISYGFQKKVFQVPLRQWIAFCQNNGCQLYFGIEDLDEKGNMSAVVLAVNQAENYNHVLTVTTNTDVIDARKGIIEVRLYPYVPTHNVMNMFASYRKSNPKTFVSK